MSHRFILVSNYRISAFFSLLVVILQVAPCLALQALDKTSARVEILAEIEKKAQELGNTEISGKKYISLEEIYSLVPLFNLLLQKKEKNVGATLDDFIAAVVTSNKEPIIHSQMRLLEAALCYRERQSGIHDELDIAVAMRMPEPNDIRYEYFSRAFIGRILYYTEEYGEIAREKHVLQILKAVSAGKSLTQAGCVISLYEEFPIQTAIWIDTIMVSGLQSEDSEQIYLKQNLAFEQRKSRSSEGVEEPLCEVMCHLAESDKWWLQAASLAMGYAQAIRLEDPIWEKQLASTVPVVKQLAQRLQQRETLSVCGNTSLSK